ADKGADLVPWLIGAGEVNEALKLPALVNRGIALAFAGLAVKNFGPTSTALGDELGKPPEQRDKKKIADLWSDLFINSGVAVGAGYGALRPGIAAESPAVRKLFVKSAVQSLPPEKLNDIFRRVLNPDA